MPFDDNNNDNDDLDINALLNAVNNVSDDAVLSTSLTDIDNQITEALKELGLSPPQQKDFKTKLQGYRLITDIDELAYGAYTKIIKLKIDPHNDILAVKNAGFMTSLNDVYSNEYKRTRVLLKCRLGRHFSNFVFEECLVFQKLNHDDMLVMGLVDYLRE